MIAGLADPFEALFRLQRELEGRRASDWLEDTTSGMGAYPPINVFQQGHDFVAIVELPGVDKGDLELQAKENTIAISGKKSVAYGDKVSVHRRERVAGNFDRTIAVPVQIDPNGSKPSSVTASWPSIFREPRATSRARSRLVDL